MVPYFGDFPTSATVYIPINTFDSNDPAASVTATNLVNTDVHIHKDGGTTQRNNAAGITMTIDYDSITGNHLLIIDTSDNTVADFYQAGHEYMVRVEGVTVDAGTINAWVGSFSIERAGGALALLKSATYGLSALETLVDGLEADTTEILTRLPDATAGANGGLLIAGSNAATTFASVTCTAALTTGSIVNNGVFTQTGTFTASAFTVTNALTTGSIVNNGVFTQIGTHTISALTVTNALTAGSIVNNGVFTQTGAVTLTGGINAGAISGTLANDIITAASINTGAFTADAFAADAIIAATLATGVLTADAFAADSIVAATIKADAVTKIQAGLATPTNITAASGVSLAASQKVDVDTIKTKGITCADAVTILANIGFAGAPGAANGAPTTNGTKVNQTVDLTAGQTIAATVAGNVGGITGITFPANFADLAITKTTGTVTPVAVTLANGAHGGAATVITLQTPISATVPDTQKVDLNTVKTKSVACADNVTINAYLGETAQNTAQTGDTYAIAKSGGKGDLEAILTNLDAKVSTRAVTKDVTDAVTAIETYGDTKWLTATGFAITKDMTDAVTAIETYGDTKWLTATGFSKAGDQMDLVDAPNAKAVTAIQLGLSTFDASKTAVAKVTLVDTCTANTDMIKAADIKTALEVAGGYLALTKTAAESAKTVTDKLDNMIEVVP